MPATIHVYRPQRTSPEDLERIFVAREPLVQEILDRLGQWRPSASRQHYLLIGPRGIGKTCVLEIIAHRIRRNEQLGRTWVPLALPEEGYGLNSVADLFVRALGLLGDETSDGEVCDKYREVRLDSDDRRALDLTLDAFRRFHARTGKCVLMMLENANRVLDRQLGPRSQRHLLRKILIEEEWLAAICTSPTYVNAVAAPEEPLFEFFQVKPLGELTLAQQESLLRKLAALEQNATFEEYLREFRSRLQALYHFTGGNPRLAVMLYDLIAHHRITDVQEELDSLLDQLTPFYQDRMRDLADQEARLLEQMALLPEGCTPTELAREARMAPKTVRAVLGRLEQAGYVRREERRKRQTVYIIPERFFRIWHQMSHSRPARGRLQYLLEFFFTWYATRRERDRVWDELNEELGQGVSRGDEGRVEDVAKYMEYIAAVSKGAEKYERELQTLRLAVATRGGPTVESRIAALDGEYGADPDYHVQKGRFLADELGDHQQALSAFDEAVRLRPDDAVAHFNRAVALDKLGLIAETVAAYRRAAVLLTKRPEAGFTQNTEHSLLETLETHRNRGIVWVAARLLGRIGDVSTAEEIVRIARGTKAGWRRRCCTNALGLLGGMGSTSALLEFLHDRWHEVRGSAATALGRIGSEQAVGPLIECLDDEASDVRGSAATALGRIGSEQAVGALIDCLDDEASNVRGSAATALGRIGSEHAVGALIECLQDEASNVRGSSATALGRIGSEQAVGPLMECLKDEDPVIRGGAATALGRIGSEEALQALIECFDDEAADVRGSAAYGLGLIGSERAVVPLIQQCTREVQRERWSYVTALGRIAANRVVPYLSTIVETVLDDLSSRPTRRMAPAARALLRSAFKSSNLAMIGEVVEMVRTRLPDGDDLCAPHRIALAYLESNRDPAIIERQHPEMRDAVALLVDAFDHAQGARPASPAAVS